MDLADRYDSLIQCAWAQAAITYHFDSASWGLVKWQIKQESAFDPEAVNQVSGARGLMQLEPATWGDLEDFERHWDNPERNIARGVGHLGFCWGIFKAEQGLERWKFALAAYDAGQAHIIKAQAIAAAAGQPTSSWDVVRLELPTVTGAKNAAETIDYVRRIMADYLAAGAA